MSEECYSLDIQGERRGPYTLRQLDHLLNSGLIAEESLYWRDGMEQWRPITELIALRRPRRRWKLRFALVLLLLGAVLFGRFFGPAILESWRELAQYNYTERAAYWRARDMVRHEAFPPGAIVTFGPFSPSEVALTPEAHTAEVTLHTHPPASVAPPQTRHWQVHLHFDPVARRWSEDGVMEAASP